MKEKKGTYLIVFALLAAFVMLRSQITVPVASHAEGTIVYTNKVTPVVRSNGVSEDFAPCIALVVSHSDGEYTSATWFDEQVSVLSTDISESSGSCAIFPPASLK